MGLHQAFGELAYGKNPFGLLKHQSLERRQCFAEFFPKACVGFQNLHAVGKKKIWRSRALAKGGGGQAGEAVGEPDHVQHGGGPPREYLPGHGRHEKQSGPARAPAIGHAMNLESLSAVEDFRVLPPGGDHLHLGAGQGGQSLADFLGASGDPSQHRRKIKAHDQNTVLLALAHGSLNSNILAERSGERMKVLLAGRRYR